MKYRARLIALALLIAASVILTHKLAERPMHNDEAVNAWFLGNLLTRNDYRYDPTNYHGPILYYLQAGLSYVTAFFKNPSEWLSRPMSGVTAVSIRMGVVLASVAFLGLLFLFKRVIGSAGVLAAMALLIFSPDYLFFSRYFIHEIFFILFTAWFVLAMLNFRETRKPLYFYQMMAAAALLFTTKETMVIVIVVLNLAWLCAEFAATLLNKEAPLSVFARLRAERAAERGALKLHIVGGVALAAGIWLVLFSSFFNNWNGLWDSLRAFSPWLSTGLESGHNKEFIYYWRKMLLPYEAPLLVFSLVGTVLAVARKNKIALFFAFWWLGIVTAHSLIPYKTPWLVMNFLPPMALLSGWGVQQLFEQLKKPLSSSEFWRTALVPLVALVLLALQIPKINDLLFVNYDNNEAHPQVYAHTSRQVYDLLRDIERAGELSGLGKEIPITSVTTNEWPLPFYLRDYRQAYYWRSVAVASELNTAIIIAEPHQRQELLPLIPKVYAVRHYELRPGVPLDLYIGSDFVDE